MRKIFFLLLLAPAFFFCQVKKMDVPFTEYTYDGNSCNGIRHFTGSLIFIPQDAFVNDDGSACKGKVTIFYRELHTRADMLVSGVNMFLNASGKRKMLESAGMFEIKATCDGKPMKIAPGKSIQVRMNCRINLPRLKAYVYNFKNNSWSDAGTEVMDFSFKKNDNSADNVKLWGSTRVQPETTSASIDEETMMLNYNWDSIRKVQDSIRIAGLTSIVGKLPDGYIKGMNIAATGLYNYDAVLGDEKVIPIIAKFKLKTGEEITEKIYVAYAKKNMLVYYVPEDMKERFALLPEKGIRIFTVFPDGSVAVLDEKFIDGLNLPNLKGQEFTFELDRLPGKPKDKAALAEATRVN